MFSFVHMAQFIFGIGNGKPVIGIGYIQIERFFIKMERFEIAFFKIKRNAYAKPGVGQLRVHFYRLFVKSPRIVHLLQLFIAFANGAIGIGIGLFVLKSLAVHFYRFGIFFKVHQSIALIKIGRCKTIFY